MAGLVGCTWPRRFVGALERLEESWTLPLPWSLAYLKHHLGALHVSLI